MIHKGILIYMRLNSIELCLKLPCRVLIACVVVSLLSWIVSCGGSDVCQCTPTAPASKDFRRAEKHVPLPNVTPVETTVAQILAWPPGLDPTNTTPRTGRELTLYHITTSYLQNARLISFDCDIHLEISDIPEKAAPRVIVETPIDSEYCNNRKALQDALAHHGFRLRYVSNQDVGKSELPQAVPVSVLGLAFRDFEHNRGSQEVGTPWELHPADVTVLQESPIAGSGSTGSLGQIAPKFGRMWRQISSLTMAAVSSSF